MLILTMPPLTRKQQTIDRLTPPLWSGRAGPPERLKNLHQDLSRVAIVANHAEETQLSTPETSIDSPQERLSAQVSAEQDATSATR